jgi:abequosyltransferase
LNATQPLLTIGIPTWNRARYLALALEQLRQELGHIRPGLVEILISDNCSPDQTEQIVADRNPSVSPWRYLRNSENIGSDANIAQCFNLAKGKYVLILGDDDLLLDGALASLCSHLRSGQYGVVCLRPYGYERDFRREYPGGKGRLREFTDAGKFLAAIGPYMTLISSCVINKDLLANVDARTFCGGNLVQVHLVMQAALRAERNLYVDDYQIACKRNNSGGYDFSRVFVEEFGRILDQSRPDGLSDTDVEKIETRMLLGYYPYYLLRQRRDGSGDLAATAANFVVRFRRRPLFWFWLAPTLYLPRALAIAWGTLTTFFGRAATGELRRGMAFAVNRIRFKG